MGNTPVTTKLDENGGGGVVDTRFGRVWGFGFDSDKNNGGDESGIARSMLGTSGVTNGGGRNFSPVTGGGRRRVGLVGRKEREREVVW